MNLCESFSLMWKWLARGDLHAALKRKWHVDVEKQMKTNPAGRLPSNPGVRVTDGGSLPWHFQTDAMRRLSHVLVVTVNQPHHKSQILMGS